MLMAIADGFQCACSRATALDLEAVSMDVQALRGFGGLDSMSKTPRISINMGFLTQDYLFSSKIDKIEDISIL